MPSLKDKKVVVVGASHGIGFAVAKACLGEGASVTLCSSNEKKLQAALSRLATDRASIAVVDVRDESAVKTAFESIGSFDHLVYTATSSMGEGFPDRDIEELNRAVDTYYWGMLRCVKHTRGLVKESIVTTSGAASVKPGPSLAVTAGFGGATTSTTRGLALDLAPVRVNCITPGLVDTELWSNNPYRDVVFNNAKEKLLVKHVGQPEEIAEAYLFAMKCTYLTGQSIVVDGGSVII